MTPIDSETWGAAAVQDGRFEMFATSERIYLLIRERQSRAMATRARDPAVKHIHLRLAEAYARRAHQLAPEEEGAVASTSP